MSDPRQRFTWLYDQYYRRVLRYALQHADPPSAEDVASETFLIAWRRLADVPEQPLPWLLVVARNLLRKQSGQARRQQRLADHIRALTSDADLLAWDAGEHAVECSAALDALGALPDDVEALTLVTWHGLSAAAVAAAVIIVPPAHHHPAAGPGAQGTQGAGTQGTPATGAQAVLLTAARVAASRPAATGAYWYVRERDFEPTGALFASGRRPKGTQAAKGSSSARPSRRPRRPGPALPRAGRS